MTRRNLLGLYLLGLFLGAGSVFVPQPSPQPPRALAAQPPAAVAGVAAVSAIETSPPQPASQSQLPLRVLFLGNRLTSESQAPRLIGELARAAGLRPFEYVSDTPPGAGFETHVTMRRYAQHLADGDFDYVVLQEQSQITGFGDGVRAERVLAPARVLNEAIVRDGARTVLFATWARRGGDPGNAWNDNYAHMQQRVDRGYRELAHELGAMVAPVGEVWKTVHEVSPSINLWHEDGILAGPAGGYLTACVLFRTLYAHPVGGIPFHADLDPGDAQRIQHSVDVRMGAPDEPDAAAVAAQAPEPAPKFAVGILMAPAAGCAAGYRQFGQVCYHERLATDPAAREAAIAAYRGGAAPPQVGLEPRE